ncbi:MAG TPA: response regulator [Candidatus Nitrosotalea sp.]|nr:response regulator [Candidatus Nitrosotalea sp.]
MSATTASKILIVDDASFMRVVLKDILVSHGLVSQVYEAGDGLAAVESYKQFKPDIVTMDINMPKADGIQALKSIIQVNPKAKVVMVTSVEQKHIVQDAIRSGARDYVVKPFDRSNVAMVISKVIRSR